MRPEPHVCWTHEFVLPGPRSGQTWHGGLASVRAGIHTRGPRVLLLRDGEGGPAAVSTAGAAADAANAAVLARWAYICALQVGHELRRQRMQPAWVSGGMRDGSGCGRCHILRKRANGFPFSWICMEYIDYTRELRRARRAHVQVHGAAAISAIAAGAAAAAALAADAARAVEGPRPSFLRCLLQSGPVQAGDGLADHRGRV